MIQMIENWIDETNLAFSAQRQSCASFQTSFAGFYSPDFLRNAYFVAVDDIPKPDFPDLRQIGMGDFIDMPLDGITYKNTYFLRKQLEQNLRLHFHELVHVVQWNLLGAKNFIKRYILEIQQNGYKKAPLEKMAYSLDQHYASNLGALDVSQFVQANI